MFIHRTMHKSFKRITKIFLVLFNINLVSTPVLAKEIWSGRGEVVQGENVGAIIDLDVSLTNDYIRILSNYPQENNPIPIEQTTQTSTGQWELYWCDSETLCISFKEGKDPNAPKRTVYYRLYRN